MLQSHPAGLDLVALSGTDGHTGDTADFDSVSEASDESFLRMPACLQALIGQVGASHICIFTFCWYIRLAFVGLW